MADLYTMPTTSSFTDSQFGTAANTTAIKSLVNQVVDKKFHRQVQKKNAFKRFGLIGEDSYNEGDQSGTAPGYPVIRKTQLQSQSGDVIKMGLLKNLSSDHKSGGKVLNAQMVQNEQAYDFNNVKVSIERWREAVITYAGMNRQRNPYGESLEQIEEKLLSDWGADKQDTSILYALYAGYAPHLFRAYGTTAVVPRESPNVLIGNDTGLDTTRTVSSIVSDGTMNISAKTFEVGATFCEQSDFDPVMVDGEAFWVSLVSPKAVLYLLQDDRFRQAMLYAQARGNDNPLFKHAKFVYNNVVIYSYDKIRSIVGGYNPAGLTVTSNAITEATYTGIGAGVSASDLHQTFFLGANAVGLAEGSIRMGDRKEDDYGNIVGRDIDMIFGTRSMDWTSEDGTTKINQSHVKLINTLL